MDPNPYEAPILAELVQQHHNTPEPSLWDWIEALGIVLLVFGGSLALAWLIRGCQLPAYNHFTGQFGFP